jgi:hypothetical protein
MKILFAVAHFIFYLLIYPIIILTLIIVEVLPIGKKLKDKIYYVAIKKIFNLK